MLNQRDARISFGRSRSYRVSGLWFTANIVFASRTVVALMRIQSWLKLPTRDCETSESDMDERVKGAGGGWRWQIGFAWQTLSRAHAAYRGTDKLRVKKISIASRGTRTCVREEFNGQNVIRRCKCVSRNRAKHEDVRSDGLYWRLCKRVQKEVFAGTYDFLFAETLPNSFLTPFRKLFSNIFTVHFGFHVWFR